MFDLSRQDIFTGVPRHVVSRIACQNKPQQWQSEQHTPSIRCCRTTAIHTYRRIRQMCRSCHLTQGQATLLFRCKLGGSPCTAKPSEAATTPGQAESSQSSHIAHDMQAQHGSDVIYGVHQTHLQPISNKLVGNCWLAWAHTRTIRPPQRCQAILHKQGTRSREPPSRNYVQSLWCQTSILYNLPDPTH